MENGRRDERSPCRTMTYLAFPLLLPGRLAPLLQFEYQFLLHLRLLLLHPSRHFGLDLVPSPLQFLLHAFLHQHLDSLGRLLLDHLKGWG